MKASNALMINTTEPIDVSKIADFINNHADFIPSMISLAPDVQVPDTVKLALGFSRSNLDQPVDTMAQFLVTQDGKPPIGQGFSPAMLALMGIDIADITGPNGENIVAFHDDLSASAKKISLENLGDGFQMAELYIETSQGESIGAMIYWRAVTESGSQSKQGQDKYEIYVQPAGTDLLNKISFGLMGLGGADITEQDIEKVKTVYGPFTMCESC